MNPPRRYIMNACHVKYVADHVERVSDLNGSAKYRPLKGGVNLAGRRILVERMRDRGIGDLLFLTGPMSWLQHMSSHEVTIDVYGLSKRSQVLAHHPAISNGSVMFGPTHYEDLDLYEAHWMIESVTEFNEEPDQPNVYDALYRSMGVDPSTVDPRFKRPSINLVDQDARNCDALMYHIYSSYGMDLRSQPYLVFSPLSHSTLRSMNYGQWLQIMRETINNLRIPIVVVGHVNEGRMPVLDMSFGAFMQQVNQMAEQSRAIINLLGKTPVRLVASIIKNAAGVVCLDSGPLYIAQAVRTPAVSIWGTHDPRVRIGYDPAYMELSVFNQDADPKAPTYAYTATNADDMRCEVLLSVKPEQVLEKVQRVVTPTGG